MTAARKHLPSAPALRTRVLAVDYGRRRIGLALSDEMGITAQPLATLTRTNRRTDIRRLRDIARQNGVGRIVVGHPLRLDGSAGDSAGEAVRFAARIQKELGLPVELADERLSSWEAEQIRPAHSGKRNRGGGSIDAVAAAVILRDYLARRKTEGRQSPAAGVAT